MLWHHVCRRAALATLLTVSLLPNIPSLNSNSFVDGKWTSRRKFDAREKTRDLWYHGFNNYMEHAFPLDELMPLSCTGRGPDWERPHNYAQNDVVGNFSLTLLDVLDTFIVFGDRSGFERGVRNTIDWVSFDVNTRPQVFETTIRVLGGLLSAHIFAADTGNAFYIPWYKGELLTMAHDLGVRLLPAFQTPTGIPYARINLRHGVLHGESLETCTAGAGSLILEFGTLSRLTGDDRFEKAAFKAFFALWNRKSDIGLVGNTINAWTGKWTQPEISGVGAGIDSFFEYALKWYILSGEAEFLDVWHEAYAGIMRYSRGSDGFWFRTVNMHSGHLQYNNMDSLSAFWPGLQVLAGDVENAIKAHLIYWNLWRRHSGMPEVWDIGQMQPVALQYPLRPEFIESTYYLFRATGDSFYLDVGERVLYDLIARAKVECGLTGIKDLRTNKRDDRMESFVLSETLKYLYLLFDETNPLHKNDSNFVFTTEGHILTLARHHLRPPSKIRRKLRRVENLQCPVYRPLSIGNVDRFGDESGEFSGLTTGIRFRSDADYARMTVGATSQPSDEAWWSPYGKCDVPVVDIYSYDFVLSANGNVVPEDLSPGPHKIKEVEDGFIMQNVTGVRTHIVSRLDGKGYDIVKLGPYAVRRGQIVYVNDTDLFSASVTQQDPRSDQADSLQLRFYLDKLDPILMQNQVGEQNVDITVPAYTSLFGANPALGYGYEDGQNSSSGVKSFGVSPGSLVTTVLSNAQGCNSYPADALPKGAVILVWRGECTFIEKLVHASRAGAAGIVIISDEDMPINPSASKDEVEASNEDVKDATAVIVTRTAGEEVLRLLRTAEAHGFSDVLMEVELEGFVGAPDSSPSTTRTDERSESKTQNGDTSGKILYLNGHPLVNTRLLV